MLVTTGYNGTYLRNSETISINSPLTGEAQPFSPKYADHVKNLRGATGAFIHSKMIVCGGFEEESGRSREECFIIGHKSVQFHVNMLHRRKHAASIVIDDVLWVLGGIGFFVGNKGSQKTSEYIFINGSEPQYGPDLPIQFHGHAIVSINKTTYMIIGGGGKVINDDEKGRQTYYCHNSCRVGNWKPGPNLINPRRFHSAGIITDLISQEEHVIVVAGYYQFEIDTEQIFHSVEILNKTTNKWTNSYDTDLPIKLYKHSMVKLDKSLIVIGGKNLETYSSSLYKLECKAGDVKWTLMGFDLEIARTDFVADITQTESSVPSLPNSEFSSNEDKKVEDDNDVDDDYDDFGYY